jgi:HAD superfamily hydrolase (TIGR01509 family)
MIQALIFDFDGLLVDTESPAFESWRRIYGEYGHDLSLDLWQGAVGTMHGFDAVAYLEALLGRPLDRAAELARRRQLKTELSASQPLLPGAAEILAQARALGLPCALASSSDREWIDGWLDRVALRAAFACVLTADDVARTKPAPDLFLGAAACLGVPPAACLVFEDSPNGILAARAAGMRCVVVPGAITSRITLPPADLALRTLGEMPLSEILARVD